MCTRPKTDEPRIPAAIVAVGAKDFEIQAVMISLREFEKFATSSTS
jgi:hypothetical protein